MHTSDEPAEEIVRYAEHEQIDLIVMGTHGRTNMAHLLMGSVAEKVVRSAPCPVLTVPARTTPTGKTPPFKLKKILVPIDFSGISKDALPLATFLVAQFDAELILLHVVEKFPIDYLLGRELMNETITPLMKQGEQRPGWRTGCRDGLRRGRADA